MTKDYHITQEEALELMKLHGKVLYTLKYKDLEVCPCEETNTTCTQRALVVGTVAVEDLVGIINAALDEVIGEPILFASPQYESLLEHHNGHTLCSGKKSDLHTLALYAPRREK